MSLIPTYVQGDDSLYYEDPIMGVNGEWFLCFDDDEDPELVIAHDSGLAPADLLRSTGLGYKIREVGYRNCGRMMYRNGDFKQAASWFLKRVPELGPALKISLMRDKKQGGERPRQECCIQE